MRARPRIVVDTNTLISRLLLPDSVPAQAVRKAVDSGHLLVSEATLLELMEVLGRPKFDRYLSMEDRRNFFQLLLRIAELVPINHAVHACCDPKDDKFLELAVNGEAHTIITGDPDLLVLHPFQDIAILTPSEYLKESAT
jgi:putative PIN family toxin of toxin-antitoxin system